MERSFVSKRKRQALLVLPLLVIPFLTLAFWALGGGKGEAFAQGSGSMLNLQLPNAQLKNNAAEDKMSFYDQAEKDSARVRKGQRTDRLSLAPSPVDASTGSQLARTVPSYNPYPSTPGSDKDPNEEKVYQKLAQLNRQLHNPVLTADNANQLADKNVALKNSSNEEAVKRLERTMQTTNDNGGEVEDTEMNNLNQMVEKVLDIQHPERVRKRMKEKETTISGESFAATGSKEKASVSLLDTASKKEASGNGFYSWSLPDETAASTAIEAAVHESQTLVDGAVIKLRLLQEITVHGTPIPKDVFVFGIASLNGERLAVAINSIRYRNTLLPVKLTVYDLDGLPGIYIPGAITRDVAKSSVDNAAQMLEITSLDPSLKAQATSAGLGAVKSLLSKKTKLVKVVVKAGYQVLLKDASSN